MAHFDANTVSGAAVAATGHSHVIDMPQLDASSRSTVATTDHGHAIEMARLEMNGRRSCSCTAAADKGHVVIDVDAGGRASTGSDDDIPSCVVCMEPLEWVAICPCHHRVVCSMCAARIRTGSDADRCCVCRTPCPTVVVTKAVAAVDVTFTFPKRSVLSQDRRVGDYWYYATMSAYFDDKKHYKATKQAVHLFLETQQPPSPSSPCPDDVTENLDVSSRRQGRREGRRNRPVPGPAAL